MQELISIIILILIVLLLVLYNLYVKKNFKTVEKSRKRLDDLSVLNEMLKITASLMSVNDKLESINNALIDKFKIDYSTIIVFDGKKFTAKASNLDKKSIPFTEQLYKNSIFAESIQTKEAKYITVENPIDNLPYLEQEKVRAKTAIFFPLYREAVFVGFWLIESKTPKGFQEIDMQIMIEIKSRILDIIRTMSFQSSIENMVKQDLFSSLKTYEYLFTEGKFKMEEHNESTVVMYRISNIENINENFSRQAGNMIITKVTDAVENVLTKNTSRYIFVRYSGPRFAIAFPGVSPDEVGEIVKNIKKAAELVTILNSEAKQSEIDETESIDVLNKITETNNKKTKSKSKSAVKTEKKTTNKKEKEIKIIPRLNVVTARYYRGLGLEVLTKELEDFLEGLDIESSISRL